MNLMTYSYKRVGVESSSAPAKFRHSSNPHSAKSFLQIMGRTTDPKDFLGESVSLAVPTPFSENGHAVDFMMGGTAATISKTVAAPIERAKLLIQNQGAMIAAGRLSSPYRGVVDCFRRTFAEEGLMSCALLHLSTDDQAFSTY